MPFPSLINHQSTSSTNDSKTHIRHPLEVFSIFVLIFRITLGHMSSTTAASPQTLQVSYPDNYAIVQLDNGKVNAITTTLLVDLKQTLDQLDQDDKVQGVMLSGRPHAFSAGLDVVFLSTLDQEGNLAFWVAYMEAMQAMVSFSKPLVCAITGYAPAGATILALCTDYRVMGRGAKHVMGMHEFKLQMQIPEMLCDVYAYYLGEVKAWQAIQHAKLFNSDEALAVGLVDESVQVEEVIPRAERHLKKQMKVYAKVYHQSKQFFRKGLYNIVMDRDVRQLAKDIIEFSSDPYFKQMTQEFISSLKKK